MARAAAATVQPFLTWLTRARRQGEAERERAAWTFVREALLWIVAGVTLGALALQAGAEAAFWLLPVSLLATSSGLGLFQVVVFHHCSHGTPFEQRHHNRGTTTLISAVLLFKHFDSYQHEHRLHHNARKLLTEDGRVRRLRA